MKLSQVWIIHFPTGTQQRDNRYIVVGKQLCHETLDRTEKRTEGNAHPSYREHRPLGDCFAAASFPLGTYSRLDLHRACHFHLPNGLHRFPTHKERPITFVPQGTLLFPLGFYSTRPIILSASEKSEADFLLWRIQQP